MYNELESAIRLSASIQRLQRFGPNIDPQIAAFANNNFQFGSHAERKNMTAYTQQRRNDIQGYIEGRFANISKTIDGSAKAVAMEGIEANATNQLGALGRSFSDMISEERDAMDDDFSSLRLELVEEPASNMSSTLRRHYTTLSQLLGQTTALRKNITQMDPILTSYSQGVADTIDNLAVSIADRNSRIQGNLNAAVDDMSRMVENFAGSTVDNFPKSSGLADEALRRQQQLVSLEQDTIDAKSALLLSDVNTRLSAINGSSDAIAKSREIVSATEGILNTMEKIESVNYDSLMGNLSAIAERKLNTDEIIGAANSSIQTHVAMVSNDLEQKDLEVVSAIQKQNEASMERAARLSSLDSQVSNRNMTLAAMKDSMGNQTADMLGILNRTLEGISGNIETIKASNNETITNQTILFSGIVDDLMHQVNTSVPEYLAKFEEEEIGKILSKLGDINSTVAAINLEAENLFGQPSLLQSTDGAVQASSDVMNLLNQLNDTREFNSLKNETWKILDRLNASLIGHVVPTNNFKDVTTEPIVLDWVHGIESLLNGTTNALVGPSARAGLTRRQDLYESELNTNATTLTENARKSIKEINKVLGIATSAEKRNIRGRFETIQEQFNELSQVLRGGEKLINHVEPVLNDETSSLKVNMDFKFPTIPRLVAIRHWLPEFVNKTNAMMDSKISKEIDNFNYTISTLVDVVGRLKTLEKTEEKIEDDFDKKVIAKIKNRNAQYAINVDEGIKDARKELAQVMGQKNFRNELHALVKKRKKYSRIS
jgi:hypothetical protein